MAKSGITSCSKSTKTIVKKEATTLATENKTKRIKIAGNAVVITSTLKLEVIKKMEKYNPDALCLVEVKDNEENEIFRIATGKTSTISKFGITFMEANAEGFATATVMLPEGTTDKKAYIKDNFATALFMLKDLEDAVTTACAQLEAAYAKLDEDIMEV